MTTLITPNFLVDYTTPPVFNDDRCVVNAAGAQVIFERADYNSTTKKSGSVRLYLLTLGGDPAAPLFQKAIADGTNRTDWFWGNAGTVTFDYVSKTGSKAICVGTAESNGNGSKLFGSATSRRSYPTWFPDGVRLAVMNSTNKVAPTLANFDSSTKKTTATDVQGSSLWSGMPSVNQTNPFLIAFVGQPQAWGAYDQDKNYIWVVDTSVSPPAPVPLEAGASNQTGSFDGAFQGRAPWWPPDGAWVVFESNRASRPNSSNKNGKYAIFLYKYGAPGPAIQITAPSQPGRMGERRRHRGPTGSHRSTSRP